MSSRLKLTIIEGKDMPSKDLNGFSDPYCKFYWKGVKYKSSIQKRTLNPKWRESFILPYHNIEGPFTLEIDVWDHDTFGSNEFMGTCKLNISDFVSEARPEYEASFRLEGEGSRGQLRLGFQYIRNQEDQQTGRAAQPAQHIAPQYMSPPQYQDGSQLGQQYIPSPQYQQAPQQAQYYPGAPPYPQSPPQGQQYAAPLYQQPPQQPYYPPPAGAQSPTYNSPAVAQQAWPNPGGGLYPQIAPPSAPPMDLAPQTGTGGNMKDKTAKAVTDIKEILPQYSFGEISSALKACDNDKEKAIDLLLNKALTESPNTKPPPSNSYIPPPQTSPPSSGISYGQGYGDTQYAQNPAYGQAQPYYGMHPAPYCGQGYIQPSGRRKALLIGINYANSSARLNGCINDVKRMKQLLISAYGFYDCSQTMVVLTDDNPDYRYQPTRANIIMALKWLAGDARTGDALWFHFSGHGAQQRDQSGMEGDGFDETILPSDFKSSGMIVDDEINSLIVQPLPNGVRMTSVMDCCHSGTGLDLPFTWNVKQSVWEEEDNPIHVMADVQLFSGCRDDQTSADVQASSSSGEAGGAMTMAFVSLLSQQPFGFTYISLIEGLSQNMKTRRFDQRPQLSSTQRFDLHRSFNLTDIVPNMNPRLGRQYRRTKKPKKQSLFSGNDGGALLGVGGGLLAGMLLGEIFD